MGIYALTPLFSALLGFSALLSPLPPSTPSATCPASPFNAEGVVPHATGYSEDPPHLERLDVASPPRALPKKTGGAGSPSADPLGLWAPLGGAKTDELIFRVRF